MTDVYEGSLIRMFRRLEELLRQMAQASKVMGSEELEKKFEESLTKVKRGKVIRHSSGMGPINRSSQISLLRRPYIYNPAYPIFVHKSKLLGVMNGK
jgi:hypothetical protein